jgi:hypothetical protein
VQWVWKAEKGNRLRQRNLLQKRKEMMEEVKEVSQILLQQDLRLLMGEIDRPSTGRVEPVRGCLITQAVWNEPP